MANQRPIRRGRFPRWRRGRFFGRRQNRRWIDCNSHALSGQDDCGSTITNVLCLPGDPRELLVGDLDMDWSDKSEVTLARIVGDLSVHATSTTASGDSFPIPVIVRFGLLVTEDTDRVYNAIDLWDPESLEEYEWMWLREQIIPFNAYTFSSISGAADAAGQVSIGLDTAVKRKLGKKDSLVLYSQHKLMAPTPESFQFSTRYTYQLRCVMT